MTWQKPAYSFALKRFVVFPLQSWVVHEKFWEPLCQWNSKNDRHLLYFSTFVLWWWTFFVYFFCLLLSLVTRIIRPTSQCFFLRLLKGSISYWFCWKITLMFVCADRSNPRVATFNLMKTCQNVSLGLAFPTSFANTLFYSRGLAKLLYFSVDHLF